MAFLTVRTKGEDGHSFQDLDGDRVVVGRADDCDLTIDSDRLSRQHLELTREGSDWYVTDLDSANGTRVNAEKLKPGQKRHLAERDIVKAGRLRMTFHLGDRSAKQRDRAIEIDDQGSGRHAPTREQGVDDPPEAAPCPHCHAWLSIAHRAAGDSMTCTQCDKSLAVPQLVSP